MGTIYRNLSQLVNNKLILELTFNGVSHYDGNIYDHQHFYCTQCKSIIDCNITSSNILKKFLKSTKHDAQNCQILFSGTCHDCKSKPKKEIAC